LKVSFIQYFLLPFLNLISNTCCGAILLEKNSQITIFIGNYSPILPPKPLLMENILPIHLQEIIFASSDPAVSKQVSKLEKAGKIRKIAARVYSPNFTDSPEVLVRRNLFTILGRLYPGAVLSHRSALEFQPTAAGHVFLTYTYTKKIPLPGITLRFLEGHGRIEGDNPLSGELYASQMERALLENLQNSRQSGPESKTCPLSEVETDWSRWCEPVAKTG
jgi:hypothetical protein